MTMKMYMKPCGVLAAVLIGLGFTLVSGVAYSDGNSAIRISDMRHVCTKHGGRFAQSWLYNDRGAKWGEVLSCATPWGSITCQKNICRSQRRVHCGAVDGRAKQFPARPGAIAEALIALARK